eukprot:750926-Alexandrium_andersonii.AAC.1
MPSNASVPFNVRALPPPLQERLHSQGGQSVRFKNPSRRPLSVSGHRQAAGANGSPSGAQPGRCSVRSVRFPSCSAPSIDSVRSISSPCHPDPLPRSVSGALAGLLHRQIWHLRD